MWPWLFIRLKIIITCKSRCNYTITEHKIISFCTANTILKIVGWKCLCIHIYIYIYIYMKFFSWLYDEWYPLQMEWRIELRANFFRCISTTIQSTRTSAKNDRSQFINGWVWNWFEIKISFNSRENRYFILFLKLNFKLLYCRYYEEDFWTGLSYNLYLLECNFALILTGNYSRLACEIQFVRSMGYYLIQIYIPSSLIVVISWVSFWLNRGATPARVGLGVTTVLTMTTLMASTNAALPKISYVKSIDVYLGFCFFMVFASLLGRVISFI